MGGRTSRLLGDVTASRGSAYKGRSIPDRRADGFAESRQLIQELAPLQRANVDSIGYEDHEGVPPSTNADSVDDLKRPHCCVQIEARRRTGHNDQIGKRDRGT